MKIFLIALLVLSLEVNAQTTQYFNFNSNTGTNAVIALEVENSPTLMGIPISAGDEIGVFTPNDLCVGAVVWSNINNAITVWEDDPMTEVIDGILPGEEMTYRIWESSTGYEFANTVYAYASDGIFNSSGVYAANAFYKLTALNAIELPETPILFYPEDETENILFTDELRWLKPPFSTSSRIQIADNSDFTVTIIDSIVVGDTSFSLTGVTLENNEEYYWRVLSTNSISSSEWSEVWNFKTIVAIPSVPNVLSPGDGATEVELNTTLSWNSCLNAATYELQITFDESFNELLYDGVGLIDTLFSISDLASDTTYYWRVRAANVGGKSPWSDVCSFVTLTATSIEDEENLPIGFELSQNYPNPFNPSTNIRASIPKAGYCSLHVYNSLGEIVGNLFEGYLENGVHSFEFNAGNFPSGIYFYVFSNGKSISTRKMLLLK